MNSIKLSALSHEDPEIPVAVATELETEITATSVPLQTIPVDFATDGILRTVNVVAPSNLPEGFIFFVDQGNHSTCQVRVPPGGVRAGQRFAAEVVKEYPRGSHNIPYGKFRDGLCDCLTLGCCHPQCCLTFWCNGCALGQVLTRMKLSWCADEIPERVECSAFTLYFILQIVFIVFGLFIRFIHWLIMLIVTMKLRSYIRTKYQIPEKSCVGCEDFCCAFWCLPCTICQLARHTADYRMYSAACCTENGLASGAPDAV